MIPRKKEKISKEVIQEEEDEPEGRNIEDLFQWIAFVYKKQETLEAKLDEVIKLLKK